MISKKPKLYQMNAAAAGAVSSTHDEKDGSLVNEHVRYETQINCMSIEQGYRVN